jgi:transcriptional regulator with XRE-family HTH domain
VSGETFGQALRRLRQERGLSLRKLQILARYDFTYLGQVERGEKPGSLDLAITCDRALGLAGELIGIYRRSSTTLPRFTSEEDDMRRRTAMKTLVATPLVFTVGSGGNAEAEIIRLERNAEIYRHLYHGANSPVDLLGLVRDHLDTTVDLLRRLSDGPSKNRVLCNRSEIGTLAGRLAFFDLHDATQARGFYGLAHEAATQAADDALAAVALGHLAFVPAREGNVATAVDYLGGAADHARRTGAAALRSWIAAVEAELLTPVNPAASLRALDHAQAFLTDTAVGTPAWFDYYSAERLHGFRGYTLLKVGRADEARQVLTTALAGLPPAAVKQRAVFLMDIASSHISGDAPDVDQACDLAGDGAASLALAGYATAGDRLREFRAQVRPWDHTSAVRNLDERLAELTA